MTSPSSQRMSDCYSDVWSEEELGAYLSDDESEDGAIIILPDSISKIRNKVIEPISRFSILPIIVNIMWVLFDMLLPETTQARRIDITVSVLSSYAELRSLQPLFWSLTENTYKLMFNRKLELIRIKTQLSTFC